MYLVLWNSDSFQPVWKLLQEMGHMHKNNGTRPKAWKSLSRCLLFMSPYHKLCHNLLRAKPCINTCNVMLPADQLINIFG
jgi:hypothetical protein